MAIDNPHLKRGGQSVRRYMLALATILLLAMPRVLLAQAVLTPVNQNTLILSGNTNVFSLTNATLIISGLKAGMTKTNVDIYLNAHGMTNNGGLSVDRGHHWDYGYGFPGTDRTLVLEMRSQKIGTGLFGWGGVQILERGRIQKAGVNVYLITFTNAP